MDTVVARIIEIERESTQDIERAEEASRQKIEAHRRTLTDKKEQAHVNIIFTENNRLAQAILEAKRQTEAASVAFQRDCEHPFHDPVLTETIKEDMISILLEG